MGTRSIANDQEIELVPNKKDEKPLQTGKKEGRSYTCEWNSKQVLGLTAIITSVILLIFACLCAGGVFGGGKMGFIAGGLTVGSMVGFGVSAYLLTPRPANNQIIGKRNRSILKNLEQK